jgi:YesN/AraC family two-component response regulator
MSTAALHRPQDTQDTQTTTKGSILLVDDAPEFRQACTALLADWGYAVFEATCGEDALLQTESTDFDIILLDLKMPGMGGMECLRRLKENECTAEIIILTGYGTVSAAVEAIKKGAYEFVEKPFAPRELVAKIEDARARQEARKIKYDDPLVAYVKEEATQIQGREQVAERFRISMDTVTSRVRRATGQGFREFLHYCRLEEACRLLEQTSMEISQVAKRTGFHTISHFSRVFRTQMGQAPTQYRRQRRART